MSKKIVLTGGGTAGHVTPNIALMPELKQRGYKIYYIGSYTGIEKDMIKATGTPYKGISSGKLRRYFDLKNFTDPFRVIKGYFQAKSALKKLRPDVIFSKGGFVSVPVVIAGKRLGIPSVIHESDMTPGLANKLSFSSASKVCCNFPETIQYLPDGKAVLTGSPIRSELFSGDAGKAFAFCGFSEKKPVLMIMGGSLGSVAVNNAVRSILPKLLETFNVIHLCGKGNLDASLDNTSGYAQYEFISEELPDLMAAADIIVSRAGANAICEFLALCKPCLLIPLPSASSRGDQLLNARSFESQGFSRLLPEEDITDASFLAAITELYENRQSYIDAMKSSSQSDAINIIADILDELSGQK